MLVIFIVLAAFLTWWNSKRRHLLIGMSAALLWFALALWIFFFPDVDTGLSMMPLAYNYSKIIAWVFFILTFLPLVLQMDFEIKHEENGQSWADYGDKPKGKKVSAAEEYKKFLRHRMGRH